MNPPGLVDLRLGAFKSYADQRLSFEPITLLVGRNGSGKSNALDALSLLALLADERDVNDLERGDQEVAGLRGGLSGAAPFGDPSVRVGCTVKSGDGRRLRLDVWLDASARPEIVEERLVEERPGRGDLPLISARRRSPGAGVADVDVYSGGAPRTYQFLSSRLATAQAVTKVPGDSQARRRVVSSSRDVVAALGGVFVLDPIPAQMRGYVRIGAPPDRSGSTLSALAYRLRDDQKAWERLLGLVRGLVDAEVVDVRFSEGRLPEDRLVDVMMTLVERFGDTEFLVPARLMSDGTLRYLAIVSSLLDLPAEKADDLTGSATRRMLVVEEIENGLFPSQGARVLDLLRAEAGTREIRLVATTHSPALLDALRPEDHRGVVICDRGRDGRSVMQRLVDHPRYVEIAGGGTVGQAVTRGALEDGAVPQTLSLADLFAS